MQQQETPKDAAINQTVSDRPVSENDRPHAAAIKNVAVVQCEGFRCLAYRDGDVWRDFQGGKPLPEVKHVVFTFSV